MYLTRAFSVSVPAQVLPSLFDLKDEMLLRELYHRWNNHKLMVRWLSRFFNYLDRYSQGWSSATSWDPFVRQLSKLILQPASWAP